MSVRTFRRSASAAGERETADIVIIGSGYGGAMAAHAAIHAGLSVIMVERGRWTPRGEAASAPEGTLELTPFYEREYLRAGRAGRVAAVRCVGGASVFAGTVAMRFREEDFDARPETGSTRWPIGYDDLEPHYTAVERLLGVAGHAGEDPVEPRRSTPYGSRPPALSPVAERIADAARRTGHQPFRLPLAINTVGRPGRPGCVRCVTCDTFACSIGAKNDVASAILAPLLDHGLDLRAGVDAVRIRQHHGRVSHVECRDGDGTAFDIEAPRVVLAAGALASPHLLLASGLERHNPGGELIGRRLMRHCSTILMGAFPRRLDGVDRFHKQIGIHDGYWDGPEGPGAPCGSLQQLARPPVGLLAMYLPRAARRLADPVADHMTGLLAMAEDQPRLENRIRLDPSRRDAAGRPAAVIEHAYTPRDLEARARLVRRGRRILKAAGAAAIFRHEIDTFSHAVGTVRFGADPDTSVLDEDCRFRGVDGLYVIDGSVLPTSAGVNPSLTIAAVAHRAAAALVREAAPGDRVADAAAA